MDASENRSAGDGFAARTRVIRRRQDVVQRVKRRSSGKSCPQIEDDLRAEFERAGIPQTPEQIAQLGQVISGGWFGLLRSAVRIAAGGQAPTGTRTGRQRLTGERWVDVDLSTDPAARSAVRAYDRADKAIGSHMPDGLDRNLLSARLAVTDLDGASRVGVFFGHNFIGTLPPAAATSLIPAIIDADRRDQRVTVSARIALSGDLCRVSVALP